MVLTQRILELRAELLDALAQSGDGGVELGQPGRLRLQPVGVGSDRRRRGQRRRCGGERVAQLLDVVGARGLQRQRGLGLQVRRVRGPGVLLGRGVVEPLAEGLLRGGVRSVGGRRREVGMVLRPAHRAAAATDGEPAGDLGGHPVEPGLLQRDELLHQRQPRGDDVVEVELGLHQVVAYLVQSAARRHLARGLLARRLLDRQPERGRPRGCGAPAYVVQLGLAPLGPHRGQPRGQAGPLALAGEQGPGGRGRLGGPGGQLGHGVRGQLVGRYVEQGGRRGPVPLHAAAGPLRGHSRTLGDAQHRRHRAGAAGLGDPAAQRSRPRRCVRAGRRRSRWAAR